MHAFKHQVTGPTHQSTGILCTPSHIQRCDRAPADPQHLQMCQLHHKHQYRQKGNEMSWPAQALRIKTRLFIQPITSPSPQPFSSSGSCSAASPPCYNTSSPKDVPDPVLCQAVSWGTEVSLLSNSTPQWWQNHLWSTGCTAGTVSCMLYHLCRYWSWRFWKVTLSAQASC